MCNQVSDNTDKANSADQAPPLLEGRDLELWRGDRRLFTGVSLAEVAALCIACQSSTPFRKEGIQAHLELVQQRRAMASSVVEGPISRTASGF